MQISISGQVFSVSEPYAEGHRASAQEAKVLNSARAKRLSRLMAYHAESASAQGAEDKRTFLLAKLAELEARFSWGSRPSRNSVQDEIEALRAEGKLQGEELLREAERRAQTRLRVAQSALEELI